MVRTIILMLALLKVSVGGADVLFPNSVVSNDIDFIKNTDHTVESVLEFIAVAEREMPDKRKNNLLDENTFVFEAKFKDGAKLGIWVHSDFSNLQEAKAYARTLLGPLGRLPSRLRNGLSHIVVHKGNESAFAEHLGHFFVLYSENIITRLKQHDLEETLFHESVHATLDAGFKESSEWLQAQRLDNRYVTKYAKDNPTLEDLAETSLFGYTYYKHPGRLPAEVERWLVSNIPNRLKFVSEIFFER